MRINLHFPILCLWSTIGNSVAHSWDASAMNGPVTRLNNFFFPSNHYRWVNLLSPNDPYMGRNPYMGRTAPLTSKRCILCIYSTNIGTEYFKNALYSPFFFSSKCSLFHNANLFGSYIIHILYTGCAKIKKIIPAPKG